MRNLRKLLMVICVFALLTVGCVLLAYADENDGTVAELNELIAAAEAAQSSEEKYNAILAVGNYLNTKNMDTEEEGYTDAVAKAHKLSIDGACSFLALVDVEGVSAKTAYDGMVKADALLELFELSEETEGLADAKAKYDLALVRALGALVADVDEDIETSLTTAENKIAINKVNRVLKECTLFGEEDTLADIKAEFAELVAAHDRALTANYATLDNENVITNYDLSIFFTEDWENKAVGVATTLGAEWSIQLKSSRDTVSIKQDENGNKYYSHNWIDPEKEGASYIEHSLKNVDATSGLVFEFDIATFGDVPSGGFMIEPGGITTDTGRHFPPHYFYVNGNGDICTNNKSTVVLPGALVKGEWLHIVLVFDRETFMYRLYVEGEYVTEYNANTEALPSFDHKNLAFRLSADSAASLGNIAYDNIVIYGGNSYRNHTRLSDMTDDEKFIYSVDYLLDSTKSIASKMSAYELADSLLANYWTLTDEETGEGELTEYAKGNETIANKVAEYLDFDLTEVIEQVKRDNLIKYVDLVKELDATERKMENVKIRQAQVESISEFVVKNEGLFNNQIDGNENGIADYTEYNRILVNILKEIEYDKNSIYFIAYLGNFEKATTIIAKERYYNRVDEMIKNDQIDIALIKSENDPEKANFADLVNAYEIYLGAKDDIYRLTLENNSYTIVRCIDKIDDIAENEWIDNREYIQKYLGVIEPIILNENEDGSLLYDSEYEGVDEAVKTFDRIYGFFYAILQDEHVEYIDGVLDLIVASDGYIEKLGMIAMIDRYLLNSNVNYSDERIISLLNNLETCKEELVLREADYSKLLLQNSVYFINLVERMRTAETYKEQRYYYDEAALLYFYLDTDVEGAKRAVQIFDEYKVRITNIEEASQAFVDAVVLYSAAETEEEKYAALVACYENLQFAELSYDGMEEAMEEYQAAYDAHMSYAESVNSTLEKTGNTVGSVRANSGVITVIAVIIKKIFGV